MIRKKLIKVLIHGRYRSMRLEDTIADGLAEIAAHEGMSVGQVLTLLDERYRSQARSNFTAHVRLLVLAYYRWAAEGDGGGMPPGSTSSLARALDAVTNPDSYLPDVVMESSAPAMRETGVSDPPRRQQRR